MGPLIALLPTILGMLQKNKQKQHPGAYDQTPPAPAGTADPNADEIAKSRSVIANMEMPKDEKIGDALNDKEPDADADDKWNLLGGGGGGY